MLRVSPLCSVPVVCVPKGQRGSVVCEEFVPDSPAGRVGVRQREQKVMLGVPDRYAQPGNALVAVPLQVVGVAPVKMRRLGAARCQLRVVHYVRELLVR